MEERAIIEKYVKYRYWLNNDRQAQKQKNLLRLCSYDFSCDLQLFFTFTLYNTSNHKDRLKVTIFWFLNLKENVLIVQVYWQCYLKFHSWGWPVQKKPLGGFILCRMLHLTQEKIWCLVLKENGSLSGEHILFPFIPGHDVSKSIVLKNWLFWTCYGELWLPNLAIYLF